MITYILFDIQVNEENPTLVTALYQQPRAGVHRAHVIDENGQQSYRHRIPPERRTPEVYGRGTNLENLQPIQSKVNSQHKDYYNGNNFVEPNYGGPPNYQHFPTDQLNNVQKFTTYNPMSQQDLTRAHQYHTYHPQAQNFLANNFYNYQNHQYHQEKPFILSR